MTAPHTVVWLDHRTAKLLSVVSGQPGGSGQAQQSAPAEAPRTIHANVHSTAQHGSAVRDQHEFFAEVCKAIESAGQVLVTGGHTALADLQHYVDKHRPPLAARIAGYEVVDHMTDNQLVAQARTFFAKYERMAGGPRVS